MDYLQRQYETRKEAAQYEQRQRQARRLWGDWNRTRDEAAAESPEGHMLAIHGAIQDALGWLTPAEIEEVVAYAIREGLDDAVVEEG